MDWVELDSAPSLLDEHFPFIFDLIDWTTNDPYSGLYRDRIWELGCHCTMDGYCSTFPQSWPLAWYTFTGIMFGLFLFIVGIILFAGTF